MSTSIEITTHLNNRDGVEFRRNPRSRRVAWRTGWGRSPFTFAGLLTAMLLAGVAVNAASLSEPPTVLYGKVLFRSGGHELALMEGELSWTLRGTVPQVWERRFTTRLASLGNGQYSYRLPVPHDLLSHDLTISDRAVPLLAIPSVIEHSAVLLNGRPGIILAPAANFFSVRQTQRAAAMRVDLDVSGTLADTDGDGLPDLWEDQRGYDKWNPADGIAYFRQPGETSGAARLTFAQWRTANFPGDTSDLDVFSVGDADADGLPNLVEYAFDLNPGDPADLTGLDRMPQGRVHEGVFTVEFEGKAPTTEIEYRFEVSSDLAHWQASETVLSEVAAASQGQSQGRTTLRERAEASPEAMRFVRLEVVRRR